jgi:hypothetical protein
MPTGPEYLVINEWATKRDWVRDQVLAWPAADGQRKALIWLDVYTKWAYKDQDELIVTRDEVALGLEELLVKVR